MTAFAMRRRRPTISHIQQTDKTSDLTFYLKTSVDPLKLASSVRSAVAAIDPQIPVLNFTTQENQIHSSLSQERLFASLTSSFGILALLLSSIGIYGVMRYSVTRRTNEVGIRLALGAQPSQILRLLFSEGLLLAAAGLLDWPRRRLFPDPLHPVTLLRSHAHRSPQPLARQPCFSLQARPSPSGFPPAAPPASPRRKPCATTSSR